MENAAVAALFAEMADLLEIQGGDQYRIRAFRRISRVIENQREPVAMMLRHGTLLKLPGVGEGGYRRIKDILATGTCGDLTRLRAKLGPGVRGLMKVRGIGAKTVRVLHAQGISSVEQLELAARLGTLRDLPGFGDRTTERILGAIEAARKDIGRVPLPAALALGGAMVEAMRADGSVLRAELAGSVRRRKSTIGDLDILVASNAPAAVIARFVSLPQVGEILLKGAKGRASVRAQNGQQVDLRVLVPEEFGAGMHYFTGSQQHNIYVRARGNRRGLKISDHGIFRRADEFRLSPGRFEEEIFAAIGVPFIAPELRENCGELEAAERGQLPALVVDAEIRGELHVHDAGWDPHEWAASARALGLEYLALTGGADAALLRRAQDKHGVRLLRGASVKIAADGTLDGDSSTLRDAEWVIAGCEDALDLPRAEMTARLVRAMETGLVDCIAHPTNRIIDGRDASDLDMEKLLRAAVRCNVSLEISGDPMRLDLDDVSVRRAREIGASLAVTSDATRPADLAQRMYAVFVARRGWLERKDVLNTFPVAAIEERRRARLRKAAVATSAYVSSAPVINDREVRALARALEARTLSDELRERLDAYLQRGDDPTLEAALRRQSDNPLQAAFSLLTRAS